MVKQDQPCELTSVGEMGSAGFVLFFVQGSLGHIGGGDHLMGAASWVGQHLGSPFGTSSLGGENSCLVGDAILTCAFH